MSVCHDLLLRQNAAEHFITYEIDQVDNGHHRSRKPTATITVLDAKTELLPVLIAGAAFRVMVKREMP